MFHRKAHAPHDFELNLTPIIDCFVTLICFMLLSATYVNLVGMEAKVPISVPSSSAAAQNEPKFKLELEAKANGMQLTTTGAGALSGRKFIPMLKTEVNGTRYDLATLHSELVKIKRERPKEFAINFKSATEMQYGELVRFMDTTRNLLAADGTFTVTDERNGKPVKIDLLFPDFVMENL